MSADLLPLGVRVLERGWLSSNNILIEGAGQAVLVDSGYCQHAAQTVALVAQALQGRPLDVLLNTHLHSDHCGGNAALQAIYTALHTHIPPGNKAAVDRWDPVALGYTATGQDCPRFHAESALPVGDELWLGGICWQVHAAPGHDPHSIILFAPQSGVLLSADALWERGFGVVFADADGVENFSAVGRTLDLIADLQPRIVIPGHGAPFTDVRQALGLARERLRAFGDDPGKHRRHAAKVLLKFRLMQDQQMQRGALRKWVDSAHYMGQLLQAYSSSGDDTLEALLSDLGRSGAIRMQEDWVYNC